MHGLFNCDLFHHIMGVVFLGAFFAAPPPPPRALYRSVCLELSCKICGNGFGTKCRHRATHSGKQTNFSPLLPHGEGGNVFRECDDVSATHRPQNCCVLCNKCCLRDAHSQTIV